MCIPFIFFPEIKMSSPVQGKRRMDTDVIKLIESKHEVTILGGLNELSVKFYGTWHKLN